MRLSYQRFVSLHVEMGDGLSHVHAYPVVYRKGLQKGGYYGRAMSSGRGGSWLYLDKRTTGVQ